MKTVLSLSILFSLMLLTPMARADITEEGRGIIKGSDHPFALKAPKGWVLDTESAVDEGIQDVFYPKTTTWADSMAVIYARSDSRDEEIKTVEDVVADVLKDFHDNDSPNSVAKRDQTFTTTAGQEGVIYRYTGDRWGNFEAVAYFTEDQAINFVVFTARTEEAFNASLGAFEELIKSYEYLTGEPSAVPREFTPSMPPNRVRNPRNN